ncbi:nucleotidyltransferase family protein [Segeticoccus rhizosphaerae]|uniref:nucleotidyltransferase family protein n=1 Tax=Segeticoccus rhizosphaerae TaxID=1104777 RepID=UPI0012654129|nr:nucleotidyltransferase family protein [Segeticoccus rhizosphaerae]
MTVTNPNSSKVAEVFGALDEAGIRWALLRGLTGLGEEGRDIDLLVSADDLGSMEKIIYSLGAVALPGMMHPWHRFYVLGSMRPGRGVKLDVVTKLIYRRNGPIHTGLEDACLDRRRSRDGINVLDPTDMFWTVLLHCVFDKQHVNDRRRAELVAVVDEVSRGRLGELVFEGLCPANWSAERVLEAVGREDWDALNRLGQQLAPSAAPAGTTRRREWLRAAPAQPVRAAARSIYPALWRAHRRSYEGWQRASTAGAARMRGVGRSAAGSPRRQVRVSFSGLDGAGKTRQIDSLVATVGEDHSVEVLWIPFKIWPEPLLNRLPANFRSRLGPKRRTAASGERAEAVGASRRHQVVKSVVWTTVATLSAVSAGLSLRRRAAGSQAEFLVLDRYRLDTIVKLQFWYADVPAAWLSRVVGLIAPAPDVEFLLRVDPEVAYARKPEQWSVAQLSRQAQFYDHLAAGAFPVVTLDAHQPSDEIAGLVRARVRSALDDH